jgi:hypothetical protein
VTKKFLFLRTKLHDSVDGVLLGTVDFIKKQQHWLVVGKPVGNGMRMDTINFPQETSEVTRFTSFGTTELDEFKTKRFSKVKNEISFTNTWLTNKEARRVRSEPQYVSLCH